MSKYALQAILTAAAEDESLKARIQNPETMQAAVAEVLSLTEEEKHTISSTLANPDMGSNVAELENRETPGPGTVGGLRM